MLRPNTLALTGLLLCPTAIGPLSVDMYSPSLPAIARAFGATDAHIQLSVSAYLIGFAVGQIVYGRCRTVLAASRSSSLRSSSTLPPASAVLPPPQPTC